MSTCLIGYITGWFGRTLLISEFRVIYKKVGLHLEGVWLWRICEVYSHEMICLKMSGQPIIKESK